MFRSFGKFINDKNILNLFLNHLIIHFKIIQSQKLYYFKKGLNGAGKTTTFRMITGELEPSQGEILIKSYSIRSERFLARRNFGHCPQFDRLPEFLTVKETLKLFADLRGLFKDHKEIIVEDMIEVFGLNKFTNVLVQRLRYFFSGFFLNIKFVFKFILFYE